MKASQKIRNIGNFLDGDLRRKMANTSLNVSKGSFRSESWNGAKWPARKREERPRRALLVKTGKMKRSGRWSSLSNGVKVYYEVPYAIKHIEGRGVPQRKFLGESKEMNSALTKVITKHIISKFKGK